MIRVVSGSVSGPLLDRTYNAVLVARWYAGKVMVGLASISYILCMYCIDGCTTTDEMLYSTFGCIFGGASHWGLACGEMWR